MRNDMARVIVERPRKGGGTPKGWNKNVPLDELPDKESMRRKYRATYTDKELNEFLQPLYRYILSKVGSPWDGIYSEICQRIKLTSTVQRHILEHVSQYVSESCYVGEDKKIYDERGRCICSDSHVWRGKPYFYVHPETGILCQTKHVKEHEMKRKSSSIKIDDSNRLENIDGIWYFVEMTKIPNKTIDMYFRRDVVFKKSLIEVHWNCRNRYGCDFYASKIIKQANKKEIAKHGLKNKAA